MALPKRPSELLQQVMTVFKGVEKKLDKLQDDVEYQSQTLTDLKVMIANMSGLTDLDVRKPSPKKVSSVQYEAPTHQEEPRKSKKRPLPNKLKAKSLPVQKFDLRVTETKQGYVKIAPSAPVKQTSRLSKAEAPRKATTLRTQKNKLEKIRSKPKKQHP